MSIYNIHGETLYTAFDYSGNAVNNGYDINGVQIYPDVLTDYEMFYPYDAASTYEVANGWDLTLTAEQFLSLKYDEYVSTPPDGITVTKKSIGKDSTNTYDIYEYDFKPVNPKRKILLMSGEHAYEITAQFGLAHLIYHIYRIGDNPAFAYIRNCVEVKVIPIFNPIDSNL